MGFGESTKNKYHPTTGNKLYAHAKTTKHIEEHVKKRINRVDCKRTFKVVISVLMQYDDIHAYFDYFRYG